MREPGARYRASGTTARRLLTRPGSEAIVLAVSLIAALLVSHQAVALAWSRQWASYSLLRSLESHSGPNSLLVFSVDAASAPAESQVWPDRLARAEESASDAYGAGMQALVNGNNTAAVELLGGVRGQRTTLAGYFRGLAMFRLGDPRRALVEWERSGTLDLVRARALARIGSGVSRDAEAPLQLLASARPDDPQAWMDVGDVAANLGQFGAAAVAYRRALDIKPTWLTVRARLAQLSFSENHDLEGAREQAMALLASDGLTAADAYNAYALLSRIALAQGDADSSLAWARKLLPIKSVAPRFGLREVAGVLEAEGRNEEALEMLQRALSDDPSDPVTLSRLGSVQQAMGDTSGAARTFRQAIQAAPNAVGYRAQLAELLSHTGQADLARAEWARVLALDPGHAAARARLATYVPADARSRK